jgi:hypothetical protein
MTLFHALFFWLLWRNCFYLICQVANWSDLYRYLIFVFALSFYALSIELKSDQMMLFEISPQAVIELSISDLSDSLLQDIKNGNAEVIMDASIIQQIQQGSKTVEFQSSMISRKCIEFLSTDTGLSGGVGQIIVSFACILLIQIGGYKLAFWLQEQWSNKQRVFQAWMRFILDYKKIFKNQKKCLSYSRFFYGVLFWLSVVNLCLFVGVFFYYLYLDNTGKIHQVSILSNLSLCLFYFAWIPLRFYANGIKSRLFGIEDASFFQGGKLDVFVYVVVTAFFVVLIFALRNNSLSTSVFLQSLLILCFAGFTSVNLEFIDQFFGLKSNPWTWCLWFPVGWIINALFI